jgi:hypothetical protein
MQMMGTHAYLAMQDRDNDCQKQVALIAAQEAEACGIDLREARRLGLIGKAYPLARRLKRRR